MFPTRIYKIIYVKDAKNHEYLTYGKKYEIAPANLTKLWNQAPSNERMDALITLDGNPVKIKNPDAIYIEPKGGWSEEMKFDTTSIFMYQMGKLWNLLPKETRRTIINNNKELFEDTTKVMLEIFQ